MPKQTAFLSTPTLFLYSARTSLGNKDKITTGFLTRGGGRRDKKKPHSRKITREISSVYHLHKTSEESRESEHYHTGGMHVRLHVAIQEQCTVQENWIWWPTDQEPSQFCSQDELVSCHCPVAQIRSQFVPTCPDHDKVSSGYNIDMKPEVKYVRSV